MDENQKRLEGKIGKVPEIFKELKDTDPDLYGQVMGLDQMIWADGALSKQTKKIIAVAIAAALRDWHAVRAQMAGAGSLGVSKEELEEGLRVAFILAGMPAYVHGKTALEEYLGNRPRSELWNQTK